MNFSCYSNDLLPEYPFSTIATNDIHFNFLQTLEAKKQGSSYVISKFLVKNKNLEKVFETTDNETLYLYKIN